MSVEVADGVLSQAPGLRLQGGAERGAVATVEVVEGVDPLDEERVPLSADLRVRPRPEGEHRADPAPADAAEVGRLPPGPPLPEAQHLAVVADRRDYIRDREDGLGASQR